MLDLFGGHVLRGAHHAGGDGESREALAFRPGQLGQAEVGHFHPSFFVEYNVGRLDVPVDDPLIVRELKGVADFHHDAQGLGRFRVPSAG